MKLNDAIASTEGHIWSSEKEVGELLASIIKMQAMTNVLEAGVFKGRTGCYMIDALPEGGQYFGVDIEDHRPEAVKEFMQGHKFILGDSREELKKLPAKYFDLIFIDSVHELNFLRSEFHEAERIIKTGGIIALHDAHIDGVKAMIDYVRKFNWFEVLVLDTLDEWLNNRGIALIKCLHDRPGLQPGTLKGMFTDIYKTNFWKSAESRSGTGSEIKATEPIRKWLSAMVHKYNINSMTDCACGDFNWMRLVILPKGFQYTGLDIVDEMIRINKAQYESKDRKFMVKDITSGSIPKSDLIFCKDVFLHLSFEDIKKAITQFIRSGAEYMILSNAYKAPKNIDQPTGGGWRPINLEIEPFKLPPSIERMDAGYTQMSMYRLSDF
jgi:predicted O-methyltransferase YrrM